MVHFGLCILGDLSLRRSDSCSSRWHKVRCINFSSRNFKLLSKYPILACIGYVQLDKDSAKEGLFNPFLDKDRMMWLKYEMETFTQDASLRFCAQGHIDELNLVDNMVRSGCNSSHFWNVSLLLNTLYFCLRVSQVLQILIGCLMS